MDAAWRGERGCRYVKAGVLLDDLCPPEAAPPALFDAPAPRSDQLMRAMDKLNTRFGRNTVFPAAMGIKCGWKLRADEVINRFGLAIRHDLTAKDLKETMLAYPAGTSDIGYMV